MAYLGSFGTFGAAADALIAGESVSDSYISEEVGMGLIAAIAGSKNGSQKQKNRAAKQVASKMGGGNSGVNRETTILTDKSLLENRLSLLPSDAQQKLLAGDWQIVPYHIYSIKYIGGLNHIDMFKAGDQTQVGVTNIVQGKMPAEDYALFSRIQVRTATNGSASGTTDADGAALDYNASGDPVTQLLNGEWAFGQQSTTYIDKCAANMFGHKGNTNVENGLFELSTPKIFYPQRAINCAFDFVGTAPANTWCRVDLMGVKTTKA